MKSKKQRRRGQSSASLPGKVWAYLGRRLAEPVDGASLAAFRICFGLVMAWHIGKYLWPRNGHSLLELAYATAPFNFRYLGFEWVRPWPEPWLSVHFIVAALAAILVAAGLFYRLAAVTLFIGYVYIFLLEASSYNNHYYLICLLAFLLILMPATRRFSIDGWWKARRQARLEESAAQPTTTIPFWPIFILRFQLFVIYFFGGIAKINADWLTGEPLMGPAERLYSLMEQSIGTPEGLRLIHIGLFMAWGGLVYDLSVGFMLLFRRTRWIAIGLTFLFHLHNHIIFPIGVFPTLAFSATLIFFAPDWPIRLFNRLRRITASEEPAGPPASVPAKLSPALLAFVTLFVAWQSLWPFRHYFIAGDANWTEEAQDFSWRMMLRSKSAGYLIYRVDDPEMYSNDAGGRPQVNWSACAASTPRAVYASIDSPYFRWRDHPGLGVTFEPVLGTRVVYNPIADGYDRAEATRFGREKITERWQQAFGRDPLVEETISLDEALLELDEAVASEAVQEEYSTADLRSLSEVISVLKEAVAEKQAAGANRGERQNVALAKSLQTLLHSSFSPVVRPILSRLHPFEVQGAALGDSLLVVWDTESGEEISQAMLRQLSADQPYLVWVDFSRLRPIDWCQLPRTMVTFESRGLHCIWNHFLDLNPHQLEQFCVRPFLIRQYARHIADQWRQTTGRTAAVHATSDVMMNYHFPQPLVDSRVDLASVSYWPFRHNSWILPHKDDRIGVSSLDQRKKR